MKKAQKLDYKKELEAASRSMILIHNPDILIKMIVRMIVQKVRVSHAGILLYYKEKDTYVLTVSRGVSGLKIPAGFARMDPDNPLIHFFRGSSYREIFKSGVLEHKRLSSELNSKRHSHNILSLLKKVKAQMEIFEAVAYVPSFFRDSLMGILLLGKKQDNCRFAQGELDFFSALASDVAMALRNAQLFAELEHELEKRHKLFIHTTIALAAAIDAKDHYTHGHTSRVTTYSLSLAQKLKGKFRIIDDNFMENLHIASLLHDIGKIGVPERVLRKNSDLTIGERKAVEQHPLIGVTILQAIRELKDSLPGVKYHHERYDGKGYPEGLKGEEIPLMASIIAVADTYDAMTTDRSYRTALTKEQAMLELLRCSGRQFNPSVIKSAKEVF